MKNLVLFSLVLLAVLAFGVNDLVAQPPSLPSAPSQAPLDGGLSLLALGGGVYALKKLRDSKR